MIDLRVTKLFFDRPAVKRAMSKGTRAALSKAGAFIRTTARRSLLKRKGPAPPGHPPHTHTGLLKRFLFFAYEPAGETVVVGPAKLNKRGQAPQLLEFGGTVRARRTRLLRVKGRGRDARGRYTKAQYHQIAAGTRLKYAPRPYMGPALAKERPKLPRRWAGAVQGG